MYEQKIKNKDCGADDDDNSGCCMEKLFKITCVQMLAVVKIKLSNIKTIS